MSEAYKKGVLQGSQGKFMPAGNLTRAEAATVTLRLLDKTTRKVPEIKTDSSSSEVVGKSTRVLDATDSGRELSLKPGDTVVRKHGTKVVLQVDKASGVIGAYQGVEYYAGIKFKTNGYTFKEGDLGTDSMSNLKNTEFGYAGQPYLIYKDKATGYTEGHFSGDWEDISEAELQEGLKIKNPVDGQRSGKWSTYDAHDGTWCWEGPVNQ